VNRQSIGIVGGGAAGLAAAHLLQRRHDVTLFEKERRLGGHAHTHVIAEGVDSGTALDVGFMVFNDCNYPLLQKLLKQLGNFEIAPSEMSFGYRSRDDAIQYSLNLSTRTSEKFPLWSPVGRPGIEGICKQFVIEIIRFCEQARRDLHTDALIDVPFMEYIKRSGFSEFLIYHYLLPMGASIWSAGQDAIATFPADHFLRFFDKHGLLSWTGKPTWQHLRGGSHMYINAIRDAFRGTVLTGARIAQIARNGATVDVYDATGSHWRFDHLVIAVHADEALRLLSDPTPEEKKGLGAWHYGCHQAVLHYDESVMPHDRRFWASWNYRQPPLPTNNSRLHVTYHLNRLQGHGATQRQYFLTLSDIKALEICEDKVLALFAFDHPICTSESLSSPRYLYDLGAHCKTYYCGSYTGIGFHEDAVRSGVEVARRLGVEF
jgi:predicted NAD/FAD-binding protein